MGYTHYWSFKKGCGDVKTNERRYQLALKRIQKIALKYQSRYESGHPFRLSGYTAYSSFYGGININGAKDLRYEDFTLREHFNKNSGDCCKTARKPYDVVVTAALIILKHQLKGAFEVESDGTPEDWLEGLALAREVTGLKSLKLPKTITDF